MKNTNIHTTHIQQQHISYHNTYYTHSATAYNMSQHILHTFSISVSILTKCVILSLVRSINKRTKCMTNLSSAAPTRAPSASSVSLPQHRQVHQVHHQSLFRSTNTVTKCIRLTSFPSQADIAALTGDLKLRIEYNFVSY